MRYSESYANYVTRYGELSHKQKEKIVQYQEEGLFLHEIAFKIATKIEIVYSYLKSLGILREDCPLGYKDSTYFEEENLLKPISYSFKENDPELEFYLKKKKKYEKININDSDLTVRDCYVSDNFLYKKQGGICLEQYNRKI